MSELNLKHFHLILDQFFSSLENVIDLITILRAPPIGHRALLSKEFQAGKICLNVIIEKKLNRLIEILKSFDAELEKKLGAQKFGPKKFGFETSSTDFRRFPRISKRNFLS